MDETLRAVAEFHRAFRCHEEPEPCIPSLTGEDLLALHRIANAMHELQATCFAAASRRTGGQQVVFTRLQLIQEELAEFARGLANGSLVEALDGLGDLQYVVDGSWLALGAGRLKLPVFREIHRSNMTKLGHDGEPVVNEAGRVVKGPHYEPPNLRRIINEEKDR